MIPGRGYRFVAPVTEMKEGETPAPTPVPGPGRGNLPVRLTSLLGRDQTLEHLAHSLTEKRLLTLVGPGGIGKTSVAVAVAHRVAERYPDGTWLVDLAPLEDPQLMPLILGPLLGVPRSTHGSLDSVLEFVSARRMLIVLDNCERLVEESARLAERILAAAPGVHIVATSREALRIPPEQVFRLPPLETPPGNDESLSATGKRSYPAVSLFIERALTRSLQFDPSKEELEFIADICRRLDGNPLAIELAAAATGLVGVGGIAAGLDRRFALLTRGYRTSAARHRTLRAVMDWSYDFLPTQTRTVLCRLSVFRGAFSLEAAEEIAQCPLIGNWEVVEHLTSLTDKSLVTSVLDLPVPEFRLLETVRAYAGEKFRATGELDSLMQRLAERCSADIRPRPRFVEDIGISPAMPRQLSAPGGRPARLVGLGICRRQPLATWSGIDPGSGAGVGQPRSVRGRASGYYGPRSKRLERTEPLDREGLMRLYALVAPLSGWMESGRRCRIESASRRLLELASDTGRVDFQLSALRSLFLVALLSGQNFVAREYCTQMAEIGRDAGDPYTCVVAQQRIGAMSTIMGEHDAALRTFADMALDTHPDTPVETVRYFYEPVCIQKSYLARTLWCVGDLDSALHQAGGALERANRLAHLPTQFVTLIQASALIPLWTGPRETAAEAVRLCSEVAGEDRSRRKYARVFSGCLQIKYGDAGAGTRALCEELLAEGFDINTLAPSQAVFYAVLAEGFYLTQRYTEALRAGGARPGAGPGERRGVVRPRVVAHQGVRVGSPGSPEGNDRILLRHRAHDGATTARTLLGVTHRCQSCPVPGVIAI